MTYMYHKFKEKDIEQLVIKILLFLSIGIVFFAFSDGILGNDFWWHVKVGEYILENRNIPTNDIFSWIGMEKNIEWTAHEWLSDLIFYIIFSKFGEIGIYLFSVFLACILITIIVVFFGQKMKKNLLISAIYLIMLSVLTSLFFYGRPHIFSYFLLFFELKILYDFYENKNIGRIYLLPVISILWSNLHGGSSNLCYILCFVFLIISITNIEYEKIVICRLDSQRIKQLLLVSVLTILCIFVNPIGIEVFSYPYKSLGDSLMMSFISEWQSPDAKSVAELILYFLPIFILSIGFIINNKKIKGIDLILLIIFLFLFFRSIRFVMLWYIATPFFSFNNLIECKIKKITKKYEKNLLKIITVVLFLFILYGGYNITKLCYTNDNIISKVMDEKAIEYIKNDNPKRIFNDYNLGEMLIYNDVEVFFDARADLFSQQNIMLDGISLLLLQEVNDYDNNGFDAYQIIEKYKFDRVLILKDRPLYSITNSNKDKFQCLYEDDLVVYYKVVY